MSSRHLICSAISSLKRMTSSVDLSAAAVGLVLLLLLAMRVIQVRITLHGGNRPRYVHGRRCPEDLLRIFGMTNLHHLRCVCIEYCCVVCLMIFCENLLELVAYIVTICLSSLNRHLDSTVRHECSL